MSLDAIAVALDRLTLAIEDLREDLARRDTKPANVPKRARPRATITPEQAHAIAKRKLARAGAVKSVR